MRRISLIGCGLLAAALAWCFVTPPDWYNSPGLTYYKPNSPTTTLNTPEASDVYFGGTYVDVATYSDGTSFGVATDVNGGSNHLNDDPIFNKHNTTGNRTLLSWKDHAGYEVEEEENGNDGLNAVATLEWYEGEDLRRVAVSTGHVKDYGLILPASYIYDGNVGGDSQIGNPLYNLLDESIYYDPIEETEGDGIDIVAGLVEDEPRCWALVESGSGFYVLGYQIVQKGVLWPDSDYVLYLDWVYDGSASNVAPDCLVFDPDGYVYVAGTKQQYGGDFYLQKLDGAGGSSIGTVTKDFGANLDENHVDILTDACLVASDKTIVLLGDVHDYTAGSQDFGVVQYNSSLAEQGTKQLISSPGTNDDFSVRVQDFGEEGEGQKVVIVAGSGPMVSGQDYMFAKVPVSPLSTTIYVKGHGLSGTQTLYDMDVRVTGEKRIFMSGINGNYGTSCEWEDEEDATPVPLSSHTGQPPGYGGSPYTISSSLPLEARANAYCAGIDRLLVGGGVDSAYMEGGTAMWRLEPQ